jgi:diaminopimelate decarboxylase
VDHFGYVHGHLHCEDVPLDLIAREVGTPVYVYSTATLRHHARVLKDAFAAHWRGAPPLIAFAVKANSNLAVLRVLAREGLGADTVSGGEIRRALKAGMAPGTIVFSGVGKSNEELDLALAQGVYQINVESAPEMERLSARARAMGRTCEIAVRVNPQVGAGAHAKITTGGRDDKFGVPPEEALALYARAHADPSLNPVGLACHIGSQIRDLAPLRAAFESLRALTSQLRADGHSVSRLDLGGGLGVPYFDQPPPPGPEAYAAMVAETLDGLDVSLVLEPGRMIAANAGVLVSRVIQVTERPWGTRILVLDAAMNDLMRPALYDAWHDLRPLRQSAPSAEMTPFDVVGPVCESGDTFARARPLAPLSAGEAVAFMSAGAYGAVMSHSYNSRLLVPEVLVDGGRFAVVRPRPDYEAMLSLDAIPDWLGA